MQKLTCYILFLVFIFTISCNDDVGIESVSENKVTIKLIQDGFETRVIDQDNLESEQTQINMAILFTEPGSDVITHKYINAGFTDAVDYKLVTLPVSAAELGSRDIYVVTNYGGISFDDVTTLDDLDAMTTPVVSATSNLDPQNGLCMFGKTFGFDFDDGTNSPAIVYAVRTCAKYRVTLTFPQNSTLSTDNSFLITGAASYTYIVDTEISGSIPPVSGTIPSNAYFDFVTPVALQDNSAGAYVNYTYVYEATQAPQINIYAHLNNSITTQVFSARLPVPTRNYLYDLNVQIYENSGNLRSTGDNMRYRCEISATVSDNGTFKSGVIW